MCVCIHLCVTSVHVQVDLGPSTVALDDLDDNAFVLKDNAGLPRYLLHAVRYWATALSGTELVYSLGLRYVLSWLLDVLSGTELANDGRLQTRCAGLS